MELQPWLQACACGGLTRQGLEEHGRKPHAQPPAASPLPSYEPWDGRGLIAHLRNGNLD
jgi:hypothetical protein